jgi:uronate dehydrogenase
MKKSDEVLVTGAAGHLGSHLVEALGREGFAVRGVDRVEFPADRPAPPQFVQADLSDAQAVKEVVAGAEVIVHCASIHPWKAYSDDQYLDANIRAAWHLYASAAAQGVGRVVLTSSIAAVGYDAPPERWPLSEDYQGVPPDLYSFTKHAQEDVARQFAAAGQVRTIALRPPAFMPRPELETGFGLLGAFALVDDVARAHVAAVRVLAGHQLPPEPLEAFEAFFCTLPLPYTREDAALAKAPGSVDIEMVRRHWPGAAEWLAAKGFGGTWLPAVYDISRARRLLGWEPRCDFDWWFARQAAP